MIVYIAGIKAIVYNKRKPVDTSIIKDAYLLSSYWELRGNSKNDFIHECKGHILDSGAFTAINDKTGRYNNFDWDNYCKNYIKFIKDHNQKLFFELDIDCVIGLNKVEYYRMMIEDAIGIAPIPVWHSNRGVEYWDMICEKYPYIAIPTTKANEDGIRIRKTPEILTHFIKTAHKYNTKIHGLGYTSMSGLPFLKFDSVDSTSWLSGGKFGGNLNKFDGTTIQKIKKPEGFRMKHSTTLHYHNLLEWLKFQKYAENNL